MPTRDDLTAPQFGQNAPLCGRMVPQTWHLSCEDCAGDAGTGCEPSVTASANIVQSILLYCSAVCLELQTHALLSCIAFSTPLASGPDASDRIVSFVTDPFFRQPRDTLAKSSRGPMPDCMKRPNGSVKSRVVGQSWRHHRGLLTHSVRLRPCGHRWLV